MTLCHQILEEEGDRYLGERQHHHDQDLRRICILSHKDEISARRRGFEKTIGTNLFEEIKVSRGKGGLLASEPMADG
jgi:hypothetical protein